MKIVINILLILSLIIAGCSENSSLEPVSGPVSAEDNVLSKKKHKNHKNNEIIKVFPAVSSITIDGRENDWKRAPKHKLRLELDAPTPSPIENKKDLSSYFKILWDQDNLYFFASIKDEEINTSGAELFERDGFEIYIDGDNSKIIASGEFDYPPSYDSNDDIIRFIPFENSALSAYGRITTENFEFVIVTTSKGYDLEVRMPFNDLPDFPGEAGHVFGVEFQTNDNDDGVRQNFLKWNSGLDESYFNPSLFGTAVLFKD